VWYAIYAALWSKQRILYSYLNIGRIFNRPRIRGIRNKIMYWGPHISPARQRAYVRMGVNWNE
jgi:hypothetical protein